MHRAVLIKDFSVYKANSLLWCKNYKFSLSWLKYFSDRNTCTLNITIRMCSKMLSKITLFDCEINELGQIVTTDSCKQFQILYIVHRATQISGTLLFFSAGSLLHPTQSLLVFKIRILILTKWRFLGVRLIPWLSVWVCVSPSLSFSEVLKWIVSDSLLNILNICIYLYKYCVAPTYKHF